MAQLGAGHPSHTSQAPFAPPLPTRQPPPSSLDLPPPGLLTQAALATLPDHSSERTIGGLSDHHYRKGVAAVQSVLYGGRGRDRDEIAEVVSDWYDSQATFENPLTLARGRGAIGDMFALLGLVPGTLWSEMGDLSQSQQTDGNYLCVFSHTLHISLFPSLDTVPPPGGTPRRAYSFFSLPSTPYPQTPSATQASLDLEADLPSKPGLYSKTHPAFTATRWPSQVLLGLLSPRSIASSLTNLHLKLHTRLLFNEEGMIIAHEDVYGLKELVEALPVASTVYSVNRQLLSLAAGYASRKLFGAAPDPLAGLAALTSSAHRRDSTAATAGGEGEGGEKTPTAASSKSSGGPPIEAPPYTYTTPEGLRHEVLRPEPTTPPVQARDSGVPFDLPLPANNSFGLVETPRAADGERRKPASLTTDEE
ncbi:hypothetical protein JCM8097_006333 [Rhodosporidiobolus ruineniae]